MVFQLEVLKAKHGDCLLLHYGEDDSPRLMVIDGGPAGVWRRFLKPRLEELRLVRTDGDQDPLDIELLMVSHIDDDHIRGILDLTAELAQKKEDGEALPYRIRTLWHNSFDDIVGEGADAMASAAVADVGAASLLDLQSHPVSSELSRPGALVLASVAQGRKLRGRAAALGLSINSPFDGLVVAEEATSPVVEFDNGLHLEVLGPSRRRVAELQESWDQELRRLGLGQPPSASAAAYLDSSVFNLASLVVLARFGDRTMLLTGDARGDDVLQGLENSGILATDGFIHVDLLKVPHHGSDRNVETEFFRRVRADHYVISGDGRHGNPEPATFEMIFEARGTDHYTLHLTYGLDDLRADYPLGELRSILEQATADGRNYSLSSPTATEESFTVDLDLP